MTSYPDFHDDVIDRLARIEEGVAGLYPRLKQQELKIEKLESWRNRLLGCGTALSIFLLWLGHDKLVAVLGFIPK